jgi:hypothetical protein
VSDIRPNTGIRNTITSDAAETAINAVVRGSFSAVVRYAIEYTPKMLNVTPSMKRQPMPRIVFRVWVRQSSKNGTFACCCDCLRRWNIGVSRIFRRM